MTQIISFFLFYAAGLIMDIFLYGNQTSVIAAMLFVLSFDCLYLSFSEQDSLFGMYGNVLMIGLSIFVPAFAPFIPATLLISGKKRLPVSFLLAIPASVIFCMSHLSASYAFAGSGLLLFGILTALIINHLIHTLNLTQEQMILLRDDSREKQLIVEEKNKALRESQDSSIRLATLQERNRIAREIHDNVGHMLTRSILQTGAIKTVNKDENLTPLLNGLHDTLNTAMNNIRESVHDLHDESVDLSSSIRDILDTASAFDTSLSIDTEINVPKKIKYGFISIVKEAVNNAVKHSNGNRISVVIREHPGFYQLLIEDNGKNATIDPESGIGLENIRGRAKELGGTVSISGGNGFRIFVCVMK